MKRLKAKNKTQCNVLATEDTLKGKKIKKIKKRAGRLKFEDAYKLDRKSVV